MKRIAFATLGCKANYADTEMMLAVCRFAGVAIVSFDDEADAYVINTCTVTAVADRQSRQLIRRPKRINPAALVVVVGCMGEVDRDFARAIDGIDAVFGTKNRDDALAFIFQKLGINASSLTNVDCDVEQSRARAFYKIQDGCNRSCAYCIIPKARGSSKSLPPNEVRRRCLLLARYHREIVLTGIDIGQYGMDLEPEWNLCSLVEFLVSDDDMPRLRLSSIDPSMVNKRMLEVIASSKKVCRHIHLSIQSGSDRTLKAMGRPYRVVDIERAVRQLVETVPGIAVTGDIIAGLPGETDDDHFETLKLLSDLPVTGLHVFPYSPREGTRAFLMPDQVSLQQKRERAARFRDIAAKKKTIFLKSQIAAVFDVIVTSRVPDADGRVVAVSDNAVTISLPADVVAYGEMGRALVTEVNQMRVRGLWNYHRKTRKSLNDSKSISTINSSAVNI